MRTTTAIALAAALTAGVGAAGAAGRLARSVQGPAPRAESPQPSAGRPEPSADPGNAPYDGRFTFVRIRFEPLGGGRNFWGREDRKWDHDFPRAERNFARILAEVTAVRPYMEGGNVLALDDPDLFKYPVAYLCEPGFWAPSDEEALAPVDMAEALYQLAVALSDAGDAAGARREVLRALELAPSFAPAQELLLKLQPGGGAPSGGEGR